jgi:hypothetical protein
LNSFNTTAWTWAFSSIISTYLPPGLLVVNPTASKVVLEACPTRSP